jgi:hypothetical protein
MANFSSRFLGLVGTAMLFAGMSYGQTLVFNAAPTTSFGAIIDRFEDTTALVGDLNLGTATAGPVANATVTVSLNLPITSQVLKLGGVTDSEVLLNVGAGTTLYSGVISGSTVTFTGVSIGVGQSVTVQNVRVNASAGSVNFSVTESLIIQTGGFINYATPTPVQVGLIQTGFSVPAITAKFNVANYPICVANPISALGAASAAAPNGTPSFSITETANFVGALKATNASGPAGTLIPTGEAGSNVNPAAVTVPTTPASVVNNPVGIGVATHGTRFVFTFSNIPTTGVAIYLPTTITGNGALTLTLGSAVTGAQKGIATANPTGWPAGSAGPPVVPAYPNVAPLTISANGTATAVYDVATTDNVTSGLSFTVPGYVIASPNFATAAQPAITLSVTPGPTAGTGVTDIPTFAAQNYPVITLNAFGLCQTNLLFPFVSTAGFDTGIAISNTGTDPLGKAGAGASAPGSCALFLYGTGGTPPAQGGMAPFGLLGVQAAPAVTNYTGTFLLSQYAGTGFTGYMIAQCSFLYGHGFAYIDYGGLGAPTSTALGYVANVLNPARATTGFESLGN